MPAAFLLLSLALISTAAMAARGEAQKEKKRQPDFLIFGTVFDEKGFALAGAEVRARVAGEKKVRGEAYSDRRGEFGIRVPVGAEYEVTVKAEGYETQVLKVNAASGANREDVAFRMKPATGGKKP